MKVIIIDDTFSSWSGHNAEYNLSILHELERRNIPCLIFAHNDVLQLSGLPPSVKPTFTKSASKDAIRGKVWPNLIYKLVRMFRTNVSHLFDLSGKITTYVDEKDSILIGDFSPRTSIAYAVWLFILALRQKKMSVTVLAHGAPQYRYFYWELLLFKTLAHSHNLTLAALNQDIADVCSKYTNIKCMAFPTPQTSYVPNLRKPVNIDGPLVSFAFLGIASIDKGFDALVDEISFLKDMLHKKTITLTIQCNIINYSPILKKAQHSLFSSANSTVGIRILEGALSAEQFHDVLYSTDVLIFPYRPEFYKYIQSGVFTQALTLGKIVIATEDTFIASELVRYGTGVSYVFGVPGALTEAIKIVVNNFGIMKDKAQRAGKLYYEIHNPKRYVDLLLGNRVLS